MTAGRGFAQLSRAMFLTFTRDWRAMLVTVLFPLVLLVAFGALVGQSTTPKVKIAEIGRVTPLDQALRNDSGGALGKTVAVTEFASREAALSSVKKGRADAAISQSGNQLQLYYSNSNPTQSGSAQAVVTSLVQSANSATNGKPGPLTLAAPQRLDSSSIKLIQYYTPGLLGWSLASAGILVVVHTLVQWRTSGLLRRLRLSPMPVRTLLGARVTVSMGIALVQTIIFLLVGLLPIYGLKLEHAWWMVFPVVLSGVAAFLAIGLAIGAWARTLQTAQGVAQIVVLPMAFLGGSFFPLTNAPTWLQWLSYVFPLRWLNEGLLNVLVRGLGPASALPQIGGLLGIALVFSLIGLKTFRWDAA